MTNLRIKFPDSLSITLKDPTLIETPDFITDIDIEGLIKKIFSCAEIATRNNIRLSIDAFNVVVPKSGVGKTHLYLTDLEDVESPPHLPYTPQELLTKNRQDGIDFLTYFVEDYVHPSLKAEYLSKIPAE